MVMSYDELKRLGKEQFTKLVGDRKIITCPNCSWAKFIDEPCYTCGCNRNP